MNAYLEHQKENIIYLIKQNLAVGDIFKRENLQVAYTFFYLCLQTSDIIDTIAFALTINSLNMFSEICFYFVEFYVLKVGFVLQFSSEELVKEVQNSIAEFKRHKQKYDEERVREQVKYASFQNQNHLFISGSLYSSDGYDVLLKLFRCKSC